MEGITAQIEPLIQSGVGLLALGIEMVGVAVIGVGAVVAVVALLEHRGKTRQERFEAWRKVWLRFALSLLLGLEFTLAADIVRTAIAPTWSEIGMLGAIAAIRTFLSYFLERDMREVSSPEAGGTSEASGSA